MQWDLACGSLDAWMREEEQEHEGKRLILTLVDLGLRTTYLATGPVTAPVSDVDLAIPFVVER